MGDTDFVDRRLAAILAADVVGYSRLMGADEAGTLAALRRHREALFDPQVAAHRGRVVKLIGDGTLVEFGSVVDAVKCAVAIQRAARAAASPGPIVLRIGINLGDVIIQGDDIYGDGVNVAARLEPLAEPGGVCISAIVNESVGSRIDTAFSDAGEVHVKNIERPIRVWKWHPAGERPALAPQPGPAGNAAAPSPPAAAGTAPAPRPSIAVLPFNNMSGDPEQEYFSDGITEDIITDLSKVGALTVIARNSSFAFKGKSFDVREVAAKLGVGAVLEGSIRRAANRVRITAQLIDAATGAHLWAERYDRELTDIFAVQDEVTRHIVAALRLTLSPADKARLAGSGTTNVEAHDCFMRGREFLFGPTKTKAAFESARQSLERAVALDPGYAAAYAGLGWAYGFDYLNRWSTDPDASLAKSVEYAAIAIAKDPNEPLGHSTAAIAAIHQRDLKRARQENEIALSLNPNFALSYNNLGVIHLYSGDPQAAIPEFEKAMRLDPAYAQGYLHFLGTAYLVSGKFETAAALFKQRIILVPGTDISRAFLASALGHLGEPDAARRIWAELLEINPGYAFDEHMSRLPFTEPYIATIRAGLVAAGLV